MPSGMERLAAGLLVGGIITIIFSSILHDHLKPIWSLFQFGGIPTYGLVIAGLFIVAASYFLVDYKRRPSGENEMEVGKRSEALCAANFTESSIIQSDPVEVVQVVQKTQIPQRTRIHLEIIMQLQLEYGTKQFKTRDAIKVIEERINADAPSTRFALHWGRTQGQIVKLGHGLYQCVEHAQNVHSSNPAVLIGEGSQDPKSTFK